MDKKELTQLLQQHQSLKQQILTECSQITDWAVLLDKWRATPQPYSQPVEARMGELVASISDYNKLVDMTKNLLPQTVPHQQIVDRMIKLVSTVSDWPDLIAKQKAIGTITHPSTTKSIKDRMGVLVKSVTIDTCPDWFINLLRKPDDCPLELRAVFDDQVDKLKSQSAV